MLTLILRLTTTTTPIITTTITNTIEDGRRRLDVHRIFTCVYIYIYRERERDYTHIHMYRFMCILVCVHIYIYIYIYIYIGRTGDVALMFIAFARIKYRDRKARPYIYICIYIHTYIHVCVYIYIYVQWTCSRDPLFTSRVYHCAMCVSVRVRCFCRTVSRPLAGTLYLQVWLIIVVIIVISSSIIMLLRITIMLCCIVTIVLYYYCYCYRRISWFHVLFERAPAEGPCRGSLLELSSRQGSDTLS